MTAAQPWMHLEQARIWILKSVEDSGLPCSHCLNEAKEHIAMAEEAAKTLLGLPA